MPFTVLADRFMRATVLLVIIASGLAFLPSAVNVFQLPKATAAVLGGVLLLATSLVRAASTPASLAPLHRLHREPLAWLLAVFIVAIMTSNLLADDVPDAVIGDFGRYAGMATYLSYAVFFVTVATIFRQWDIVVLLRAGLLTAFVVAAYGLLQAVGADPVEYQTRDLPGVFATMGNPNFASAFLGIHVPIAVWQLLTSSHDGPGRIWWWFAGAYVLVASLVLLRTLSLQGPLVALVGTGLVVTVWRADMIASLHHRLVERVGPLRAKWVYLAGGASVAGLAGAGGVLLLASRGLGSRRYIYEAAWQIFIENPWAGVGFGAFADRFLTHRDAEHARLFGGLTADTAHSVPLEMLVAGGVPLGIAYLALVLIVGWLLARGLWSTRGGPRLLLAAIGGVWLAYQVQSLISIDVPGLATVHWVSAGGVVAVAGERQDGSGQRIRRRRRGRTRRRVSDIGVPGLAALATAAVFVILALPVITRPLRADLAAADGVKLLGAQDPERSTEAFARSHRLNPWESTYYVLEATALERMGQPAEALQTLEKAATLEPGNASYALLAARLAENVGDDERATRWYRAAAERDPRNVGTLVDVGRSLADLGHHQEALAVVQRAVLLAPNSDEARELLREIGDP